MGCREFYIVDDGSPISLATKMKSDGVFFFRPKVGSFYTCKIAWLMALMKAILAEGEWALLVDADEFLDVPTADAPDLTSMVGIAEAAGHDFIPAILIDMLPRDPLIVRERLAAGADFATEFDHHYYDPRAAHRGYSSHPAIRWAFGKHWRTSLSIDARCRLFGTVDVLRKVPLIRFRDDIILHQGFHDLRAEGRKLSPKRAWTPEIALPIRHFKLVKLFIEEGRHETSFQASIPDVYHSRTTAHMARWIESDVADLARKVASLKSVQYSKDAHQIFRGELTLRRILNKHLGRPGLHFSRAGKTLGTFYRRLRTKAD